MVFAIADLNAMTDGSGENPLRNDMKRAEQYTGRERKMVMTHFGEQNTAVAAAAKN